jgi:hypothetical protein
MAVGILGIIILGGLILVAAGCGIWGLVVWLEKRAEPKSTSENDQSR